MQTDYIPRPDGAFLEWVKNLYTYVLTYYTSWSIPSPQTSLETLLNAYEAAYTTAQNPNRGKADVLHKNKTHKALEAAVRVYVKAYLVNNPAVTDEDKVAMGLPVYSHTHHPVPVPHTSPQLFIDTGTRRRLIITYKDEGSEHRGKPRGVHGVEVRWAILDHPPADLKELINSAFDTNPPLTLEFEEHERGKHVYLCGRWEIQREGEKGPDGAIEEAIIP
jgi:hypothetical protein